MHMYDTEAFEKRKLHMDIEALGLDVDDPAVHEMPNDKIREQYR